MSPCEAYTSPKAMQGVTGPLKPSWPSALSSPLLLPVSKILYALFKTESPVYV